MEQDMNKHNLYISSFKENVIFIFKILLFAILVLGYFNHLMPQYEGLYSASLEDKVKRLKSIEEAKIVLLGNSNLAFGINSEIIEDELGMPVVNMGLHASAGNAFHEEMARYNVTKGDIYIICHTEFADNNSMVDIPFCWSIIENHFQLWENLRLSDIYPMLKAYPIYLKKCINLYIENLGNIDPENVYGKSAFNEYGDIYLKREGGHYTFEKPVKPPEINTITTDRINKLDKWLENRGATLLVAGYPIGKGSLTVDEKEFIDFQKELESKLNCEVISKYTDYMYDYKYFYDTEWHLSSEGADKRTKQLIEDVKRWQKNKK